MTDRSPLARYLTPLKRWWFVIVGALLLGFVATWLTLPDGAPASSAEEGADSDAAFRATHLLIRNSASPEPINFDLVELLARQGDLTNRVIDRMEGQVDSGDLDDIVLETDPNIGTISITTTQPTPDLAANLATTYAEELQTVIDDRAAESLRESSERINDRLPGLAEEIEGLEDQITALPEENLDRRLLESERDALIEQFASEQAQARSLADRLAELEPQFQTLEEPSPVATDALEGLLGIPTEPLPRFAIFGFLALLAGALLAFGIDYLDTRIRTRDDAEDAFGLPVVAELPSRSRKHREREPIPVISDPTGVTAESFRSLRLSLLLAPTWRLSGNTPTSNGSVGSVAPVDQKAEPRTLLVTSSLTGDGKSTTVANLAASFAESGQQVLVVDCDFRRPAVGELVGIHPGRGLRDIDDPRSPAFAELLVPTQVEGVAMIRTGDTGIAPPWFLNATQTFVSRSRELADVVIFDTGPITLTNEASALIPWMDSVVLINRAGRLTRSQARGTMEQLTRLGARMAGIVMVGTNGAKRYGYYTPYTPKTEGGGKRKRGVKQRQEASLR